jgi:hypothetical protein
MTLSGVEWVKAPSLSRGSAADRISIELWPGDQPPPRLRLGTASAGPTLHSVIAGIIRKAWFK